MATENNLILNNHNNVHQEEKEDNLHDLDMDTNVQNNEDHSQIMEMVEIIWSFQGLGFALENREVRTILSSGRILKTWDY